jgi:ubiquinol-cytochrome c reductase core subunit 2
MIEKLHRAAYRDTLGQSIYVHADSVGSVTPKALEDFVGARYVSQGAAVVGTGVDHDQLVQLVRKMTFHQLPQQGTLPETKKAKYHGGEARVHMRSPLVHAALVTEGVSLSAPDHIALILLQMSLGVGPFVKYGTNVATSKIGKAALSAATDPCTATSINVSYSDSGLFGFHVVASAKDIRKVLTSVVGAMGQATKGSITDAELLKAKKQLKSVVHAHNESSDHLLSSMGTEALLAGKLYPAAAYDAALDKVTLDDVNKIAKKVINGKPTYAVVGDLTNTPYLDELMARP